jgi:hypothetical protein
LSTYIVTRGGKKVLLRKVKPEHKLQKPPGWAWNVELVEEYKRQGIDELMVIAPWENRRYSVTFDLFLQKAFVINRDYGDQLVLPEKYWNIEPIDPNKSQEQKSSSIEETLKWFKEEVQKSCRKKSRHTLTLF